MHARVRLSGWSLTHAGTGGPFFLEPKVKAVNGVENTRWELSYQPPGDEGGAVEIGQYAGKYAAISMFVARRTPGF